MKHCSLFSPFVSYEENEEMWIWPQFSDILLEIFKKLKDELIDIETFLIFLTAS